MITKNIAICTLLIAQPLLAGVVSADSTTLSMGADYSSGDYGDSTKTDTWFFPFTGKYEVDAWTLKLTVPYIRTTGPGNTVGVGGDRISVTDTSTARRTESGVGDITGSVGYAIVESDGWLVELIGKVKAPTADEAKGLGTGETDYAGQVDVAKVLGKVTLFGTVGKKHFGDPQGIDFHDPVYMTIGATQKLQDSSIGLAYDWREKVTDSGDEISEATAFYSLKLSADWKTQLYLVKGFSDASPDWGAGVVLSYRL